METPATSGCKCSRNVPQSGQDCSDRGSAVAVAPRLSAPRSTAKGRSYWLIFHAPQTASLGDATACAAPLKAVGSVLLSLSTGCQNMQIRGPESAAKSRRRRGAAGASPDPLLVWLFPAWPAAPRPSQQSPGPLPRPARLTRPPTPPGPALAPLGREPGAGGAACPDSGRSRGRLQSAPSPRCAGGGEPGDAEPPLYWYGEPGGNGLRGGGERARGRGNPSFSENWRKSGEAVPPTHSSPPSEVEGRRARLSSTPTTMCSSGVPPTRPRPAWPSHGVRPGDPVFLLVNTPTPREMHVPQPGSPAGDSGFTAPIRPRRRESSHATPM